MSLGVEPDDYDHDNEVIEIKKPTTIISKIATLMIVIGGAFMFPLTMFLNMAGIGVGKGLTMCGYGGTAVIIGIVIAVLNSVLRDD